MKEDYHSKLLVLLDTSAYSKLKSDPTKTQEAILICKLLKHILISPLSGQTDSHVKNSKHIKKLIENVHIGNKEW